uniref:Uncharacterized protein n=1 Tax=viral metagenome TaxID=1070528 RepID=A0A6M3LT18_9ZZZZ
MTNLDQIVNDALDKLGKAAKSADPKAARKVLLDLLSRQLDTAQADAHRARLAACEGDSVVLARYLGECGTGKKDAARLLGHAPTAAESDAMEDGAAARRFEARAIELESARRGQKSSVLEWMNR